MGSSEFFKGCDACNVSEQEQGPASIMLVEERETSGPRKVSAGIISTVFGTASKKVV